LKIPGFRFISLSSQLRLSALSVWLCSTA